MKFENRFYKVGQTGGTFILGQFYNPVTKEYKTKCVRDYDYSDKSRDDDELYYMPIDKDALWQYRRDNSVVQIGDVVEVVKGRKIPHGSILKVVGIKGIRDRYGRWICDYAYFDNGEKTAVGNCKIVS